MPTNVNPYRAIRAAPFESRRFPIKTFAAAAFAAGLGLGLVTATVTKAPAAAVDTARWMVQLPVVSDDHPTTPYWYTARDFASKEACNQFLANPPRDFVEGLEQFLSQWNDDEGRPGAPVCVVVPETSLKYKYDLVEGEMPAPTQPTPVPTLDKEYAYDGILDTFRGHRFGGN